MAHMWATSRAPNYQKWADRPTPEWFKNDKLGIFIHWGAYSVPAFAETSGQLGHIDEEYLFPHNPYAEWYYNTIRFPGSPAAKYHKEKYGTASYDDLIDKWSAKDFNAEKMVELFARAGAKYVVPVTKHHDGITLWDAPGTGDRNTVHRGPKRDLVDELAKATNKNGLKFGVYYSTGIDWHVWPTPQPWSKGHDERPGIEDHEYNEYAWKHCQDLIERYNPYVLWGDIDWPKAGVAPGKYSVEALLEGLYKKNPEAVINDRFGDTHYDFQTVEYGLGVKPAKPQMWQSTRGIGCSFGYNQNEDESHYMTGPESIALLVDVASEGGNLLLNVGPDEAGNIPPIQLRCLEYMAKYMDINGSAIHGTDEVNHAIAKPLGGEKDLKKGWVRWLAKKEEGKVWAFVDGEKGGKVGLDVDEKKVELGGARLVSGEKVELDGKQVDLGNVPTDLRPVCIEFKLL